MDFVLISTKETSISKDTKIFRYISFFSLLAMLEEHTMPFRKVTKFDDPWEAAIRHLMRSQPEKQDAIRLVMEKTFVSCWSLKSQKDSDALWRIYSQDKLGICIESTIGDLTSALENSHGPIDEMQGAIAPIVYENQYDFILGNIFGRKNFDDYGDILWACNKRPAFMHEDEIRVMVISKTIYENDICVLREINANRLINKIWLDPRLEEWNVSALNAYFKRINISCERSDLYAVKDFMIKMTAK